MKRNFKVLFSIITVIAVLMSSLSGMTVSGSQNKLKEKVDLAFVIDTTGSMGPYIDNVKRNISDFAVYLEEKGIELRIGIIEYRDISADGIDSTKVHKLKGSTWHYSTKDMIETLGKLNVDGGGDTPETVIDGLGYLVDDKNTMLWSSQAYKFAVVLTDANYKVANTHGIANMNEMIDLLVKNDINTSVITRTSYKNSYNSLIEKTGGIFANILSSNFSNELKVLADSILNRTKIKKAIYVLPGYLGSELYINTTDNVPMWMNEFGVIIDAVSYYIYKRFGNLVYKKLTGENYDGPILGLDSDGSGEKVFAKPPYKGAYGVYDIYEDLIKKLESEFISTNIYDDVIFFEYNWLADLNDEALRLEEDIKKRGYDKVVFVTHSTGGLLASAYISNSTKNKNRVEKAIMVAAPLYGSAYTIQAIETGNIDFINEQIAYTLTEYGYEEFFESLKEKTPFFVDFVIDLLEKGGKALINDIITTYIKGITKNSPTTYQLFPSFEYIIHVPVKYDSSVDIMDDFYKVLNGSKNMNKNLTNGNKRSHKYFRENSLNNNIVNILLSVDTTLLGLSKGEKTPHSIKYKKKFFGGSKYVDISQSENGDGVVLGISAFAESIFIKRRLIDYKDYSKRKTNLNHTSLIYNAEVLNDICDLIHKVNKNNSVRSFSNESFLDTKIMSFDENEDLGMSKYVKLYMESPQNVEVFIEDKDGNVVASIRNVKNTFVFDGEEYTFSYVETEGFDKEGFSFYSTASDFEEGLNAIIYIPNGGYKVVFKYLGDEDLQFGTEISTLNKDGEVTASATYFKNDKDETGHVITLDMTEKEVTPENIGSLSEKEADEAVKYNVDWEIDHRLDLTKIGESKKINITGEVASKVSWSSSSEEIVTVSEEGEVTAKGYGRAIVSATDGNIILKCIVTVSKEAKSIYVDDIIMQLGERVVIEPKFDSDDVIEEKITYEYDKNLGIIEINEYGVIIGLSEGTVQVTAKTSKGIKTKFNVTVAKRGIISVDSVIIAEGDVKIPTGEKTTIRAVLNPYNADNQKVLWYVEDSSIVSIEPDGLKCNIKALKEGETTISVVTNDGGFTDTVKISVSDSYKRVKGSTKIKSNNANLRYLSIEGVDISPDFKANVLVYDAVVDNNTTSVKVKAVAEDDSAKVRIEGADALQVGINTVNVIVTSEAGNTKKYTILVEREEKKDTDKEDEDIVKPEEEIPEAFSDIKGHWAEEQIMKLNRLGIIAGFPDGMVRPDRNLTRSELAVILVKTLGLSASGQETLEFADADEIPSWAYEYVLIAKENGIIHGYDDNTFKPHNKCNRQEMVTMLVNAFGLGESDKILPFNDKGEIHNYARGFVARANELGLVQGYPDNTFRPLNNITLAEAAAIIYKYINN